MEEPQVVGKDEHVAFRRDETLSCCCRVLLVQDDHCDELIIICLE